MPASFVRLDSGIRDKWSDFLVLVGQFLISGIYSICPFSWEIHRNYSYKEKNSCESPPLYSVFSEWQNGKVVQIH